MKIRAFKSRCSEVSDESGQAILELAVSALMLTILLFGAIDAARAIYYAEVIKNLTAEGSSMASRGTTPLQAAQTVVSDAGTDLSLNSAGCVIVTAVYNSGAMSNPMQVTAQSYQGSCSGLSSKIGCYPPPSSCGKATLPAEAVAALQNGHSLYVTEVYYTFSTITPIGALLNKSNLLPSQLYDAAYY